MACTIVASQTLTQTCRDIDDRPPEIASTAGSLDLKAVSCPEIQKKEHTIGHVPHVDGGAKIRRSKL